MRSPKNPRPGEELDGSDLTSVEYKQVTKQIRRILKVLNLWK